MGVITLQVVSCLKKMMFILNKIGFMGVEGEGLAAAFLASYIEVFKKSYFPITVHKGACRWFCIVTAEYLIRFF